MKIFFLFGILTVTLYPQVSADKAINGGKSVDIRNFPYMVSIQFKEGAHICGGVIISPTMIVTAAHCTEDLPLSDMRIRAGSSRYNSGGSLFHIAESHIHPKYNSTISDYDVATLRLAYPVEYSDTISPAVLSQRQAVRKTRAVAIGWGDLGRGKEKWWWQSKGVPSYLQAADLSVMSEASCKAFFSRCKSALITNRMLCAGGKKDVGSCAGDSGGPLVDHDFGEVLGLGSFNILCGMPAAYAFVGNPEIASFIGDSLHMHN